MGKITRHEFLGSQILLTILFLTGLGIPLAVVYFITSLVTIEEEVEDPVKFLEQFRAGNLGQ